MNTALATNIKIGDIIKSPYKSTSHLKVERISETPKKITFHREYVAGESKGHKWGYTFKKTTKIKLA